MNEKGLSRRARFRGTTTLNVIPSFSFFRLLVLTFHSIFRVQCWEEQYSCTFAQEGVPGPLLQNINHPPARREGGRVSPSSVFRIPHHFRCVGRPEPMAPRARCGGTTLVPDIHFFLCSPSTQAIGHAGPRDLSVRPPNPRGVK